MKLEEVSNGINGENSPSMRKHISILVNGKASSVLVDSRATLAEALRANLGLMGTKIGCNRAECGTCTVLLDGRAIYSCNMLAVEAEGARILTVEGLEEGGELNELQRIFIDDDAVQCGYCVPGILMTLKALIDRKQRNVTTKDVRAAIAGNYCRCGIFPNVEKAVADYLKSSSLR